MTLLRKGEVIRQHVQHESFLTSVGIMQILNKRGPEVEPCGTPQHRTGQDLNRYSFIRIKTFGFDLDEISCGEIVLEAMFYFSLTGFSTSMMKLPSCTRVTR